jgi:hypothetical protein
MSLPRPEACPKEGELEAFDVGWEAHEVGLSRETVKMLSPSEYVRMWALLAYDIRELAEKKGKNVIT